MSDDEYVSDTDALIYILEKNGFKVAEGDFTRIDGKRGRYHAQPVDPVKLLEAAERACRWRAGELAREVRNAVPSAGDIRAEAERYRELVRRRDPATMEKRRIASSYPDQPGGSDA